MARQTKTPEAISIDGAVATFTAAHADGFAIPYREGLFLEVVQGTGARVVTVVTPGNVGGLAIADKAITVAENTRKHIKVDWSQYLQPDGNIHVNFDATTNTTVAALYTE